jgi:hypothetical protein
MATRTQGDEAKYHVNWLAALAVVALCMLSVGCGTGSGGVKADVGREGVTPKSSVQQSTFRNQLVESGAAFYAAVNEINDTDLQKIIDSIKKLDEPWVKLVFSNDFGTDNVRKKLLRLAREESITDGKDTLATLEGRRRLIAVLDQGTVSNFVSKLEALRADRMAFCEGKKPRIHNIGIMGILTFENRKDIVQGTEGRRLAVRIPFDGRDLYPRCVNLDVKITGTLPMREQAWDVEFGVEAVEKPSSRAAILFGACAVVW